MKIKIPLRQHVGGINKPIVKYKDKVYKGQLIAVPEGLGANIHSSVSGEIIDVTEEEILIDAYDKQPNDYIEIKKTNDYLEAIKEAGIVGAGGAGFPTYVKLNSKLDNGFVVANAAECEPLLGHNMARIMKDPDLIVRGLKYIMEITGAKKGYIAIKPKNKQPLIQLGKAIKGENDIEIKFLPDMYPAGDERVIIRELFGIKLKPGQLPIEANVVVSNVETIKNIVLAIEERRPVITKDLTADGRLVLGNKVFLDVPIGTPIKSIIEDCGGYIEPYGEILLGGPFMGKKASEEDVVTKTTGGVLVGLPFPQDSRKFGLIGCECGAQIDRLTYIVENMGGEVVASTNCKRMKEVNGRFRCEEPGVCPGQAEKVIYLKKNGAEAIMVGTCET
ncbi:proline reductase-associated electron transfer protein PrdC [Keratinibaculum paraultunense]|uniref:Proline reductase-associated electron transfer protein PrdC n=2 Tax=Keratinibaculum paraultunense TaxID=1278232 RepID=A0A4R3KY34_9FIRM|nr:proline reductase-associated electron transfer protein PrdC [Keratinibaculum paraultunense]TCS90728.1 proline reductase-associated electron transfer protein PrdC [Keratinibaculum paraultunense]